MKIVVIGGTGLIGSQVIARLTAAGHTAVPASPSTGVNTLTGEGLAEVLVDADVVVDVPNSPSFEDAAALEFFSQSTSHLLSAEHTAGVHHHVALSIVGVDQVPQLGYYRAKVAQEELIRTGPIPYTIVRATQFFEFIGSILDMTTDGGVVSLPATLLQPIASADVADVIAAAAVAAPSNGILNIGGPDTLRLDNLGREYLAAHPDDTRTITTDDDSGMFGVGIAEGVLTIAAGAHGGITTSTRLHDWLAR